MQIRNYLIITVLCYFVFTGCKSQPVKYANTVTVKSLPKAYQSLSENYSNKLVLLSINTIYHRVKLNVNDSVFDFPNIYELDSLNDELKIKDKVLDFFNLHDSAQVVKKIKNWCDSYLLIDAFFSINSDIYFEELALKEKRFAAIKHYFTTKEQDINSLSISQSQMLYLDFANFLSQYTINDRIMILNNAIESKNW